MTSSPDPTLITAQAYEAHADDYARARADRTRVQPWIERFAAALKPGARVLDSGCGPGVDTRSLAEAGLQPIALDLAAAMARLAAQEVPGHVVQADSRLLPFSDESFDGVWANLSLLHLPKAEVGLALAEIRRVLRPGGAFCAGLQAGEDDGIEPGRRGSSMSALRYYARYWLDEWSEYLAAQDFETIHAFGNENVVRTLVRKP